MVYSGGVPAGPSPFQPSQAGRIFGSPSTTTPSTTGGLFGATVNASSSSCFGMPSSSGFGAPSRSSSGGRTLWELYSKLVFCLYLRARRRIVREAPLLPGTMFRALASSSELPLLEPQVVRDPLMFLHNRRLLEILSLLPPLHLQTLLSHLFPLSPCLRPQTALLTLASQVEPREVVVAGQLCKCLNRQWQEEHLRLVQRLHSQNTSPVSWF